MQVLAGTESSLKESVSDVSFFEGRQTRSGVTSSSELAGPGLTRYGEGLYDSCALVTGGEVRVIAGDGAVVPIWDSDGDFDGDSLIGKRKLVGLG